MSLGETCCSCCVPFSHCSGMNVAPAPPRRRAWGAGVSTGCSQCFQEPLWQLITQVLRCTPACKLGWQGTGNHARVLGSSHRAPLTPRRDTSSFHTTGNSHLSSEHQFNACHLEQVTWRQPCKKDKCLHSNLEAKRFHCWIFCLNKNLFSQLENIL